MKVHDDQLRDTDTGSPPLKYSPSVLGSTLPESWLIYSPLVPRTQSPSCLKLASARWIQTLSEVVESSESLRTANMPNKRAIRSVTAPATHHRVRGDERRLASAPERAVPSHGHIKHQLN